MATGRGIDHIVLAVSRLDDAAERYETLGFTLTPREQHDTRMGTSNRLAQFPGGNFIELLEVDRPATLEPHDFAASPAHFSFGAHNREFVGRRNGISMIAFVGDDSQADAAAFRKHGIGDYEPFAFERAATLPDGTRTTLGFALAFATSPDMPQIAFFTCHHKTPKHFWNPAFQHHANGANSIAAAYIVAEEPGRVRDFLTTLVGDAAERIAGGFRIPCGMQELLVVTPARLYEVAPGTVFDLSDGPQIAGFAIETTAPPPPMTPAGEVYGAFIEWRRA